MASSIASAATPMLMLPELYILRHGETEWNVEGRLQGALDSALTPKGRQQAARQGAILAGLDLSGFDVFCSPQGRAVETATIAMDSLDLKILPNDALREIEIGEWAGMHRNDLGLDARVLAGPLGSFALYEHAPRGEGLAALAVRCSTLLQGLTRPSVLVTHGITSRMLRAIATGQGRDAVADIGGGQGVVYHVKDATQKRLE